jgi:hypothetical protein
MILRKVRFWGVETVQAGYGLLEFESSTAAPLKDLAERWSKVSSQPVEPLPDVVRGFDMLANHLSHPLTDPLRHLDRVRGDPVALARLPDRYGSFLETRIKWFAGYPYPPGARDNFRGYVVISTPPGFSPDTYMPAIEADAARNGIRIVSRYSTGVTTASPYLTSAGDLVPLLSIIRRVTEVFYPGVPFGPVPTSGGSTTSIYFRRKGIATYGYSPVPANITDSARRHGNDERIFLRDYINGVELYKELLVEFAFEGDQNLSHPERLK